MCLAVPMRIVEILDEERARAESEGISYEVNTSLVEAAAVADYLIVHAGFAIEKLDEVEAVERLALFKALAEEAIQG